ncbi:MAG: N-acyl homoserine lactonase family protein [Pseudomonadota bacterium]
MSNLWSIYAIKYADRNGRTRADSFVNDDHPSLPHGMDYFVWVLENGSQKILVDTGYDADEAAKRGRPILRDPVVALAALGIDAAEFETVIITHLHYDHAGGLDRFPNATFHLQEEEMIFATGPCMCDTEMQAPFTADHVCQMVHKVFAGRVAFCRGAAQVAPGVTIHHVGGHSHGLQAVRVETASGPICLASDAAHYYENYMEKKLFPIMPDQDGMMLGFDQIVDLAGSEDRVVPGHDPLVTERYPIFGTSGFIWKIA